MPAIYITDNPLKAERAITISEKSYCPAREDGIASIEYSEPTVKLLVLNRLNFILDLEIGTEVPTYVSLVPHPDNAAQGTNWYIPVYWKPEIAFYDVEYKTPRGDYKYKNRLSAAKFAEGFTAGFKITRVFSENGLTIDFLTKYAMRVIKKGKFRYAVPNKKPTSTR